MSGFTQHPETSETRQTPDPHDQWWQDSVFLTWYARAAGIGGVFRIGHEPNFGGGISTLWFGLVTDSGTRYRRNVVSALMAEDFPADGFGAMSGRYQQTFDGRMHYRAHDEDLFLDLTVEDFYPRTDFFPPDAGTVSQDFASSHYECSGRISGIVRLAGRDHEVDGLCHRDHSWGTRRWDTLLNHRWMPGTFGPELSFGSIAWHGVDGSLRQFGYLVRDGEVVIADAVDMAVTIEADGTTCRAGTTVWTLPGGERLTIAAAPYDGVISEHHGVGVVDSICELERNGVSGFCDLEISTNPRHGALPIRTAVRAVNVDGLSHRT
ncbi:MAG: hypothetical protein HYZ38_06395 [Mycobacterium sp.]|nr:hypothetical protein [Mycobacterium sp.]